MSIPVSIPVLAFLVGLFFVGIAVVGGGIEIKDLKIPPLPIVPRLLSGLIGATLVGICIFKPEWISKIGVEENTTEPVYKTYNSAELGVAFSYPHNILSLDTTERKQRLLTLRDGDGHVRVKMLRTGLPDHKDVKLGRQHEKEELEKVGYTLTYVAPEKERNWDNWYVLSGVANNTVIYYRRWYLEDSVGSIEFVFPKELSTLYDKLIPTMTQDVVFAGMAPKIAP